MKTNNVHIRKLFTYSAVPDAVFELTHLSEVTRLFLGWALGRPDDWEFSVGHIQHTLGISEHKWRKVRNELEADGWLVQRRSHDGVVKTENGRVIQNAVRWEIEVTDEPLEQLIEEAALARREARRQGRRERAESPSPKNSRMGVPPSKNLGMEVPSSNFPSMELPSMEDSRINNKGSEQRTETSSSSSPQPPFTEPGEASTTPTTDDDDSQSPDRDDAVEATTLSALTERMAHHLPDKPAHKRNGYVCTSLEGAGIRPTQPLIDRVVQDAMALAETAASKAEADKPRAVPAEVVEWQSGHRAALQFLANGIEPDMQLELARRLEARIREAGFPEIADRCASSRERAAEAA